MTNSPILRIRDLCAGLRTSQSVIQVLTNIDVDVKSGEILGLVGESGCGKSTLAAAVLNLLNLPQVLESGSVVLRLDDGTTVDVLEAPAPTLRKVRWREISYVPQGSMNSLNPVLRVRRQMTDALTSHGLTTEEALERSRRALRFVSLPLDVLDRYPHELSGGMRQRVVIASAVSMEPRLLIADELTTALDVVTQRLILQELVRIRDELGATVILITHDMGVIAQVADRVAVMYAGRIVELGGAEEVFGSPIHPYSQGLIHSIPRRDSEHVKGLPGKAPNPWNYPSGCRFHPRCPHAKPSCTEALPSLELCRPDHWSTCHALTSGEGGGL